MAAVGKKAIIERTLKKVFFTGGTMAKENEGVWRTIMGRRVFIGKGDNLHDAMRKSHKFNGDFSSARKISRNQSNSTKENNLLEEKEKLEQSEKRRKEKADKIDWSKLKEEGPEYKKGDFAKIKPEYLDEGEDPDDLYYVVEDRGDRMVVSNFTKNKDQWNTNPLIGQNEWAKFMFEKQDSNLDDMNKKIMDRNLSGRDDRSLNDFNLKNVNDHSFRNMCIELHGHVETNIKGVSKGWKQALKSGKALDYLRNKAGMSNQEIMKFKDKYKL